MYSTKTMYHEVSLINALPYGSNYQTVYSSLAQNKAVCLLRSYCISAGAPSPVNPTTFRPQPIPSSESNRDAILPSQGNGSPVQPAQLHSLNGADPAISSAAEMPRGNELDMFSGPCGEEQDLDTSQIQVASLQRQQDLPPAPSASNLRPDDNFEDPNWEALSASSNDAPLTPLSNSDLEEASEAEYSVPADSSALLEGDLYPNSQNIPEVDDHGTPETAQPVSEDPYTAKKRRTVAFHKENSHSLLYPSATVNVLQACFLIASIKLEGNMRDGQMDMMLWMMHELFLPPANLLPSSLYLVSKILGCESVVEYEYHCCKNGCHAWRPQPQNSWSGKDQCPKCDSPRFSSSTSSRGVVILKPYKLRDSGRILPISLDSMSVNRV